MAVWGESEAKLDAHEAPVRSTSGVSPGIASDSYAGSPEPTEDEEGGAPLRSLAPGGLGSKAVQDLLRYLARHSLTEKTEWQL